MFMDGVSVTETPRLKRGSVRWPPPHRRPVRATRMHPLMCWRG